jgi:hypothetical protein
VGPISWAVASIGAVGAALLLNAGIAKIASPDQLLQAAAEVLPAVRARIGRRLARGTGILECIVAVALLIAPLRLAAAIATAVLGVSFAALGTLGLLRGSGVPCGCFGGTSDHPLGWANIGAGAVLVVICATTAVAPAPPAGYSAAAAFLASIALLVGCFWLNRHLILRIFGARRVTRAQSEVG